MRISRRKGVRAMLWCVAILILLLMVGILLYFFMGAQLSAENEDDFPIPPEVGHIKCSIDLREVLGRVQENNTVLWTVMNSGFIDLTHNLIHSWQRLGLQNYVVIAIDLKAAEWLSERNITCFIRRSDLGKLAPLGDKTDQFQQFGTKAYRSIVRSKPVFSLMIAKLGFHQVFADGDIVFLRDPMEFISRHPDTKYVDYWTQDDTYAACTGFYWMRASAKSIALYEDILATLAKEKGRMEQFVQWDILKRYQKEKKGLTWKYLPQTLFPNGKVYFEWHAPQLQGITPYIIHSNYIVGKKSKVFRFKEQGYFYIEPDSYYGVGTEDKFMTVDHTVAFSRTQAKDGLINAIAMAKVLNRKLIIPLLPCEQVGEVPYAVEMCDIVAWSVATETVRQYDIDEMYKRMKPQVDFRENYILKQPLFNAFVGDKRVQVDMAIPSDLHEAKEGWEKVSSTHECGFSAAEVKKTLQPYEEATLLVFRNLTHRFQGRSTEADSVLVVDEMKRFLPLVIAYTRTEKRRITKDLSPQCLWYIN